MEKSTVNDLITLRCLSLFFYNFKQDDIQDLRKQSREFDHMWQNLLDDVKKRQGLCVPDKEFYNMFVEAGYDTQALIIEKAKAVYLDEATHGVKEGLNTIFMFKGLPDV